MFHAAVYHHGGGYGAAAAGGVLSTCLWAAIPEAWMETGTKLLLAMPMGVLTAVGIFAGNAVCRWAVGAFSAPKPPEPPKKPTKRPGK